jgi:hypothetical protein
MRGATRLLPPWPKILKGRKFHRMRGGFATRMDENGWSGGEKDDTGVPLSAYASYLGSWVPHDGSVREAR